MEEVAGGGVGGRPPHHAPPQQQQQQRHPRSQTTRPRPQHAPRCGGCDKPFRFEASPIKGVPPKDRRLPLRLDCGHARCEDCARNEFRPGKGVACNECAHVTPLIVKPGDNVHICVEQLELDYYIFGILSEKILTPKRYPPLDVRVEIEKAIKRKARFDPEARADIAERFRIPLKEPDEGIEGQVSPTGASNTAPAATEAEPERQCFECSQNLATLNCQGCRTDFCDSCFQELHGNSRTMRLHEFEIIIPSRSTLLPVVSTSSSSASSSAALRDIQAPQRCQLHRQPVEQFCKQDQSFVCNSCVQYDHQGHLMVRLSDVAEEVRTTLFPAFDRCKRTLNLLASTQRELEEKVVKDIQADAENTADVVRNNFQALHARLQVRESEILKEIVSMSMDEIVPIQQLKNILNEKSGEIQEILGESKQVARNPVCDPRPMVDKIESALDFPVVLAHLPTSDRGIHFSAPPKEAIIGLYYKYGKLDNPIFASNAGARFRLVKAEEAPGDVMLNILEHSGDGEGENASQQQQRSRLNSSRSDDASHGPSHVSSKASSRHGSNQSLNIKPRDKSQLMQGETCEVMVSYVDNPTRFFVHRAEERPEVEKVVRHVTDWAMEPRNIRHLSSANLNLGYLYAGKWDVDGKFYRVRVVRVLPDFKQPPPDEPEGPCVEWAEAQFVDYGNVESIPIPWFRELPSKYKNFPEMCHACALHGVSPPKRAASYSLEANSKFHDMVRDRILQMSVRGKDDGLWQVDLHQSQSPNMNLEAPLSVRDALVYLDFAVFTSNLSAPDSVIPIHDKRRYLKPELPPLKLVVETFVCHVQSPKEFYVHFNASKKMEHLQGMMMKLQRTYNQDDKDFLTLFCPQPGMVCAARFSADNFWYRAVVIQVIGKRTVEVEFVDYGNRERTSIWNVKKLTDDFLIMTPQAVKCALESTVECDYDDDALELGKIAFEKINHESLMPDRQTFDGHLTSFAAKTGGPHVIHLESTLIKMVDEAVKCAMEGTEDIERFIVTPQPQPQPQISPSHPTIDVDSASAQRSNSGTPTKKKIRRKRPSNKGKGDGEGSGKQQKQCIIVSYSLTPDQFYIQVISRKDELKILERKLAKECESASSVALEDVAVDISCAAKVTFREYDNYERWCRITVLEILPKNKVRARLIDTGQVKVLHVSDLRNFQSEEMLSRNAFACRCYLHNVIPAGGTTAWSQVACEYFNDLVKRNECSYTWHSEGKDPMAIRLFVKTVEPETALEPAKITHEDVSELLIDQGFALRPRKPRDAVATTLKTGASGDASKTSPVLSNGVHPLSTSAASATTAANSANSGLAANATSVVTVTSASVDESSTKTVAASPVIVTPSIAATSTVSNDSTIVDSTLTVVDAHRRHPRFDSDETYPAPSTEIQIDEPNLVAAPPSKPSVASTLLMKPAHFDRLRSSSSTPSVPDLVPVSPRPSSTPAAGASSGDVSTDLPSLESRDDSSAAEEEAKLGQKLSVNGHVESSAPVLAEPSGGMSVSDSDRALSSAVASLQASPDDAPPFETDATELGFTPIIRDRSHEFPRWKPFNVESINTINKRYGKSFCFTSFVTYVDSRGVIWATPSNIYDDNAIHEMTEKTQKHYKGNEPVDLAGELQKGQAVMAQFLSDDDDKWYRARVDKIVEVGGIDKVDVVFIEFGNTERVFPHQIRTTIVPELMELPQLNVEMKLSHIRPANGAQKYSVNDVTMIHDLLVGNSALSRVVANAEGQLDVDSEGLLYVDFCQPMTEEAMFSDDGIVIGDMEAGRVLLAMKRAELVPERQDNAHDALSSSTSSSDLTPNLAAGSVEAPRLPVVVRSGSVASSLHSGGLEDKDGEVDGCVGDDHDLDKAVQERMRDFKRKRGEDVVPTGFATNVLEHRFMRMTAPETDFSYRVQVWADDGFHFQYDIQHPRYDIEPSLKEKKKECEESIKYEQFMQTVAAAWPEMKHPRLNLPCAARWHTDKNWYRAQILDLEKVDTLGKVSVQFVDWGNADDIRLTELRYIPLDGLRPRRRSTKGMIWGLLDLSALVVHPQLNKISTIMSNASFHGTLKNIVKLASGDLQVILTMSLEGSNEFALKDFVDHDEESKGKSNEDFT